MKLEYKIAGMLVGKKYHCIQCKKEVKGFKDRDSAREYRITRMCQKCQDQIWDHLLPE
jgi:hypothetical protein